MKMENEEVYWHLIPLIRFETEVEIPIKSCRIRRISKKENDVILNSQALKMAWGAEFVSFINCVMESPLPASLCNDVISALRIFKKEGISELPHIDVVRKNGEIIHVQSVQFWGSLYEITDSQVYTISKEEAKEFLQFEQKFVKSLEYSCVSTAINRFSYAYKKGYAGDRLVDYVIALEALFSEGSEDIGFKIMNRTPICVGIKKTLEERKRIREFVSTAYKIRSKNSS